MLLNGNAISNHQHPEANAWRERNEQNIFVFFLRKLPEVRIVRRAVYFRMYLPLVMEVKERLFIDCLGFRSVNK